MQQRRRQFDQEDPEDGHHGAKRVRASVAECRHYEAELLAMFAAKQRVLGTDAFWLKPSDVKTMVVPTEDLMPGTK